ncbi:MAG: mrcB [Panacagrimonas sp.]|nr:mrcB [Panacagrimonas sp.]
MARSSPSPVRRLLWIALAALVVGLSVGGLLLSGYLIQLDQEIRNRFAGSRWALPAQVYAAAQDLYPGRRLKAASLGHELDRLGYRRTETLSGPGTYVAGKERVDIQIRAFEFWDGPQPEYKIAVKLDEGGIAEIHDLEADAPRDIVRLDPMLIGSIYPQSQTEDRVLVRLDEVPELLRKGLVAVEDRGFYEHFGISIRGILRAAFANMRAGKVVQGASTITQQLVKNFFLTSKRDFKRKAKEVLMALLLEAHYTKDEILEAYLNEIHLGQDGDRAVHGFGLGSRYYFNKPVSELRTHEIALMVGVAKGTSYYNPRRNPERAKTRRDLVLKKFFEEDLITEEEYTAAVAEPLGVVGGSGGSVERYPAFVDLVRRQLKGQYQDDDLTNEGLRIFTTLDPTTQEALERNLSAGIERLEKNRKLKAGTLQTAGVVTSVDGGEVLAIVGGREFRYAGFNRALDSRRSIGSLAKPFVYLAALASQPDRFNLHTIIDDEPIEMKLPNKQVWAPQNYDKKLHGPQPLYMALAQSYNLPTVRAGLEVGAAQVIKTMQAAGYSGQAQPVPSVFLGAVDIAPLEVAQMYGTLAAGGYQSRLSSIRSVTTKEGTPLDRFPIKVRQTLPEGPTYLINWALTKVVQIGTARAALSAVPPGSMLAGKTGTTDDLRDSWFAGFGADRVAVVWMGRDDYKPMGFTGSSGALVLWTSLMKDLEVRGLDMIPPGDVEDQLTDTFTGLRADQGCQSTILLPYLRGRAPVEFAPCATAAVHTPLDWLREIFE